LRPLRKLHSFPTRRSSDLYTGIAQKRIEDTRRLSAVEGSSLKYQFLLNKPVTSARLVSKDQTVLPLQPKSGYSNVYETSLTLERSEEHTSELQSRGHLVCR